MVVWTVPATTARSRGRPLLKGINASGGGYNCQSNNQNIKKKEASTNKRLLHNRNRMKKKKDEEGDM